MCAGSHGDTDSFYRFSCRFSNTNDTAIRLFRTRGGPDQTPTGGGSPRPRFFPQAPEKGTSRADRGEAGKALPPPPHGGGRRRRRTPYRAAASSRNRSSDTITLSPMDTIRPPSTTRPKPPSSARSHACRRSSDAGKRHPGSASRQATQERPILLSRTRRFSAPVASARHSVSSTRRRGT